MATKNQKIVAEALAIARTRGRRAGFLFMVGEFPEGRWVRKHFPELERKLIITPDKSVVHGDVLLDDAPKHVWFERASWRPVIFRMPWNGPGSEWGHLQSWSWGDDLSALLG